MQSFLVFPVTIADSTGKVYRGPIKVVGKARFDGNTLDLVNSLKELSRWIPVIEEALKDSELVCELEFTTGARYLLERVGNCVRLDITALKFLPPEYSKGFELLLKLGFIYIKEVALKGWRQSLKKVVKLYAKMSEEDKIALRKLLQQPYLDAHSFFLTFLEKALLQLSREDWWITWLRAQVTRDYPYDIERVREIIERYGDEVYSSEAVDELYRAIRNSYDEDLDEENIAKLAREARSRGELVVFTRLGRASIVMGYLLAASKVVKISEEVLKELESIENLLKERGLDEFSPALFRLKLLCSKSEVDLAQLIRCVKIFLKDLQEYEQKISDELREKLEKEEIAAEEALSSLEYAYSTIVKIKSGLYRLLNTLHKLPSRHGAFVFFGQRISPQGAYRIALINENIRAYKGPAFGLEEYMLKGGYNVYCTPSLRVLKYVDYWIEALPLFIHEVEGGVYEIDYENLEAAIRKMAPYWALNIERAEREGTRRPTFCLVTTQSYNMTHLVRFWLEEEMALFNIIRAKGLEDEVKRLVREYRAKIAEYAYQIVEEQHLHEALSIEIQKTKNREKALINIIYKDPLFAEQVAHLALVKEHRLENRVEKVAAELVEKGLSREKALVEARRKVLSETYIDPETFELTQEPRGVALIEVAKRYLRDHLDLAESTARKEVIVRHGLLKELENYWYSAEGPRKKYNLAYTPSRVDLGPNEIPSVIDQGQPIGPVDAESAAATKELFDKINVSLEGVYTYTNTAGAEGQKTLENASRDDNYAFANVLALTAQAMESNAYSIVAYINMRPTHLILWPGRGYGGFCIPKDGLFVSYVLSLRSRDILSKLGVPEYLHNKIAKTVEELIELKQEYEDLVEWMELVREKVGYLLEKLAKSKIYVPPFSEVSNVVERLSGKGDEWTSYLRKVASILYEARYVPSRMVNNYMPYHTAACMYHALDLARKRNPRAPSEDKAVFCIQASYKPGVQDSRLSTEFEVFLALTKSKDRLKRFRWSELRELASIALDKRRVPGEVRVVDPLINTRDWLFDSEIALRKKAEELKEKLLEAVEGLTEDDIRVNVERFGADYENWIIGFREDGSEVKLSDRSEAVVKLASHIFEEEGISLKKALENALAHGLDFEKWPGVSKEKAFLVRERIRGLFQWLVVYTKGIVQDPGEGLKGVDVLSLGIPHPEILAYVLDLPRLRFMMTRGNPNSALAIVDGTAGARGPVFDKDLVKEWLALGGTYVAIGVSDAVVEEWRREMELEKKMAEELLNSVLAENWERAEKALEKIVSYYLEVSKYDEIDYLRRGYEVGVDSKLTSYISRRYRALQKVVERLHGGYSLRDLDFASFIALGGRFLLASKASDFLVYEDWEKYVRELWRLFEKKLEKAPGAVVKGRLSKKKADEIVKTLLLREKKELKKEKRLGGALKGEMREEWEVFQRRIIRARQRRASEIRAILSTVVLEDFETMYKRAKDVLGEPRAYISEETYTKFLVLSMLSLKALAEKLGGDVKKAEELADRVFKLGGISIADYKKIVDYLAELAHLAGGDKGLLELVAMAAELVDIAFALELTLTAASWKEVWVGVATFFDKMLNCHIFDYKPYLYCRASFAKDRNFRDIFTRKEMFELIERRYKWLYEYLRDVLLKRTELRYMSSSKVEKLLNIGTDRDPLALREGYAKAAEFVFKLARIRDLATLYHDGFFIPEVLEDVDLSAINADSRVNIVILYNLGNTTAMTFLKRAPFHHRGKGPDKNIILTNFLRLEERNGITLVYADYGLMFLTKEEYEKAGGRGEVLKLILDPDKRRELEKSEGRFVFAIFKKPILVHAVWPHFTHPWFIDQTLEKIGVPLMQSRVIERLTYEKTEMPLMINHYSKATGDKIEFIDQVNIYRKDLKDLPLEERIRAIEDILLKFSEKHHKVIIKTSTESGGRGTIIALLRKPDGSINNENILDSEGNIDIRGFKSAINFIVNEILPKDDAVIQEFIPSNPREILTKEALDLIKRRFEQLGILIKEDTPLYWNFRNYVTQAPGKEPEIVGWIMLVHVKGIANYGQGGQLFALEKEMFKPEYRHLIDEMEEVSKKMMKALELYAPVYAKKKGISIGKDLTGVSYAKPMIDLSDLMLKPVGEKKWAVVPIEENVGMGLFYPYEKQLAQKGREGESVDPILLNFARLGKRYKNIIESKVKPKQ